MRSDHVGRYLVSSQQPDEKRPGNVEEIGGFLRRKLGIRGDNLDRAAISKGGQCFTEYAAN